MSECQTQRVFLLFIGGLQGIVNKVVPSAIGQINAKPAENGKKKQRQKRKKPLFCNPRYKKSRVGVKPKLEFNANMNIRMEWKNGVKICKYEYKKTE